MRKLFVSFTSLLKAMSEGKVTQEDLDTGLFYLGCAKAHAVAPWAPEVGGHVTDELTWFYKDADVRAAVHRCLLDAFAKAEEEGRAAWRTREAPNTFERLNELLEVNGFAAVHPHWGGYNYPAVAEAVAEAGLALEVVHV